MREILFRAKRKDNGEWVYGDFIHSWHKKQTKSMPMIYNNMGKFEIDRETVCEYTGLKDKNGTKIFEGDVVKCIYFQNGEDRKIIGTVAWYERGCCYLVYPNNAYNFRLESGIRELEVIGNKFDNNLEVQDE